MVGEQAMEQVTVHGCTFGDGIPKICVPIVGRTKEEILDQAQQIRMEARRLENEYHRPDLRVSMIEFRADFFQQVTDHAALTEVLENLRKIFADRLLLFTYRSEEEGGNLRNDRAESMGTDLYEWVITSGLVDLIDVELMSGNYHVVRTTTRAHEYGVTCVVSYHNFESTPRDDRILDMLRNMEILGGDILKCVSMPRNEFDVRRIMELCTRITRKTLPSHEIRHPVVLISMGELGKITRISGRQTGSAFTFASAVRGNESAPGQLTLSQMFEILSRPDRNKTGSEMAEK